MRRRVAIAVALALLAAALGSAQLASAADPWRELHRPLDLPQLAPGEDCPVSPIDERVDWESTNIFGGSGTGPGPVYPGLGSSEPPGYVTLGGGATDDGWYREKVFWYVKPSYRGRVLIRGARLDRQGPLQFIGFGERGRSPEMRVGRDGGTTWSGRPPGSRGVPSGIAIRDAGCYGAQFDGARFSRIVVFAVSYPARLAL